MGYTERVNPSWLVLGTPAFLIGVLVVMGWIERRLTRDVVSDEVRRYLVEPEPPDFVEQAVTRLLDSVALSHEWAGAGSNRPPAG